MEVTKKLFADSQVDLAWQELIFEAKERIKDGEEAISSYLHKYVINHGSLVSAFSFILSEKLKSKNFSDLQCREIILQAIKDSPLLALSICDDLKYFLAQPDARSSLLNVFLMTTGFHALGAHRIAHYLWLNERIFLAYYFQSQISLTLGIDIHPGARLGQGVLLLNPTGVVIGETAIVGDGVTIKECVTLGGADQELGGGHLKVGRGAVLNAGVIVLGNINICENANIKAGSIIVTDIIFCPEDSRESSPSKACIMSKGRKRLTSTPSFTS